MHALLIGMHALQIGMHALRIGMHALRIGMQMRTINLHASGLKLKHTRCNYSKSHNAWTTSMHHAIAMQYIQLKT